MNFSRRQFLSAAVLGSCAFAVDSTFAGAPIAGTTPLSVHRMKLGDFEVTTLLDGYVDITAAVLLGDQALIKQHLEAASIWGAPIRVAINTFLVNTGERLVMIDCGAAHMFGPTAGRMPQALRQAGIDPAQVDEVYITHMHPDHLHGAVAPEGTRLFPNAVLRIARADVEFWTNPEIEAKAPAENKRLFLPAKRAVAAYGDRLQPFELGSELTPGIRSIPAVGHTPGHSCYLATSGKTRLLFLGDLMHVAPVQFARPEITVRFDVDQDTARARRRELFEMVANEAILVAAVHLPFPGIGRLRTQGGSFTYEPLPWQLY